MTQRFDYPIYINIFNVLLFGTSVYFYCKFAPFNNP